MLNVLVVEDEEYVRKSIVCKIDWEQYGFHLAGEAENAIEALRFMDEQDIDIVITDIKMPEISGLELIEKLKNKFETMKFIIVSGYSEFEYAKMALSYSVSEYLLKPVKEELLVKALAKVKEEILQEKSELLKKKDMEEKIRENSEFIKSYYITKLIQPDDGENGASVYLNKLKGEFRYEWFRVSILRVIPRCEKNKNGSYKNSMEQMFEQLREIYGGENVRVSNNLKYSYDWIILENLQRDSSGTLMQKHLKAIETVNKKFYLDCIVGSGTGVCGLSNISESYANAEYAVKEAIVRGINRVIEYGRLDPDNHVPQSCISEKNEEIIQKYLESGNVLKLNQYVRQQMEGLARRDKNVTHHVYFQLALDLFVSITKFLHKNLKAEYSGGELEPEFINELSKCCTLAAIMQWCAKCIDWYENMIGENITNSSEELVASIKKYISNNYSTDISLNLIADKYNISPNYLSRVFKAYTNECFKSYVTKMRMEKAFELIMNSELKLYDVSEIVGYEDPKYFSKVFKNYFGFPPSRFTDGIFQEVN